MQDPIHIISLGAGVQSSTMALMAARGEITPMPKCAIFADTGDEPRSVYVWLDWLERQLPYPVYRVQKGIISVDSLRIYKSKLSGKRYLKTLIPAFTKQPNGSIGLLGRKCTRNYKVDVIVKKAKDIAGKEIKAWKLDAKRNAGFTPSWRPVTQWIGISVDEAHRMKDSHVKWSEHRWPLIEKNITRKACLGWMKIRGYPEPPRSACVYCPFHSDAEWQRLRNDEPEEFQRAVRFEIDLQHAATKQEALTGVPYLTRRCVPLDTVDFNENKPGYEQLSMFGNECEGLCGV